MKQDTAILICKALCYMLIGAGVPMGSSLAQWGNSGQWPEKIQWVCIILGGVVGGATQLLSFLSGAYSDYVKGRADPAHSTDTTQFIASKMAKETQPPKKD